MDILQQIAGNKTQKPRYTSKTGGNTPTPLPYAYTYVPTTLTEVRCNGAEHKTSFPLLGRFEKGSKGEIKCKCGHLTKIDVK